MPTALRCAALLLAVLALSACDGPADDAKAPAAAKSADGRDVPRDAAEAAVPVEDFGEFKVAQVLLGNAVDAEDIVRADAERFAPGDTLHASVLSTGAHAGLTLSARWLAPGGAIVADTAQSVAPEGPTATTFTLKNPEPWPAGAYTLEIRANNTLLETRAFTIE